jgi:hypothetical protein
MNTIDAENGLYEDAVGIAGYGVPNPGPPYVAFIQDGDLLILGDDDNAGYPSIDFQWQTGDIIISSDPQNGGTINLNGAVNASNNITAAYGAEFKGNGAGLTNVPGSGTQVGATWPMVASTNGSTVYVYPFLVPSNNYWGCFGDSFWATASYTGNTPWNFLTNMSLERQGKPALGAGDYAVSGLGITNWNYQWTNGLSNSLWTTYHGNIGPGARSNLIWIIPNSVHDVDGSEVNPDTGTAFTLTTYSNWYCRLVTNMESLGILVCGASGVVEDSMLTLSSVEASNFWEFSDFVEHKAPVVYCAGIGHYFNNCEDAHLFNQSAKPHLTTEGYYQTAVLIDKALNFPSPILTYNTQPAFQGHPELPQYTGAQVLGTNTVIVNIDTNGYLQLGGVFNAASFPSPSNASLSNGITSFGNIQAMTVSGANGGIYGTFYGDGSHLTGVGGGFSHTTNVNMIDTVRIATTFTYSSLGLTGPPSIAEFSLICSTNDATSGLTVGQEITLTSLGTASYPAPPLSIIKSATSLTVVQTSYASVGYVGNFPGGVAALATFNDYQWRMYYGQ